MCLIRFLCVSPSDFFQIFGAAVCIQAGVVCVFSVCVVVVVLRLGSVLLLLCCHAARIISRQEVSFSS